MSLISTTAEVSSILNPMIRDLGLILMSAGVAALLFKKIKQPLVLGYLIAGFLTGNNFAFFPSVKDHESVEVWAEIGVIFLLFSLGLEFSFKKLMKVGFTASVTAITQILTMIFLGYGVGYFLNWPVIDSIFLGVIISISSTTIILKTFDELGVKTQKFAANVFGALIVQDIMAVIMMVLLSTIVVSQNFSSLEIFLSILKLLFFLTIWFIGGIFFIPTLLKKTRKLMNDEMTLIFSVALCLIMVIFASKVGFSPALGAFIMGSIIAETTQAEQIEELVKPVKNLFGAVFFVSAGMLINPETLYEYAYPVGIITLLTIFGQSISSTVGALLSGQPLKQSVQTGMSLSQIGEFSFIIATMGLALNVTSSFLYPTIVAVSAISTFTTPLMVKMSTPFSEYLEKKLPRRWIKQIERYSANAQAIKSVSDWQIVLRAFLSQIVVHSVIIIACILTSSFFILPLVEDYKFGKFICAFFTLIVITPFIYGLSLKKIAAEKVAELMLDHKYRKPIYVMMILRIALGIFFLGFLLNNFFSPIIAFITLVGALVIYYLLPKELKIHYYNIESHFLKNLNDRELAKFKRRRSDLTPWDGHITYFDIAKESNIAGKTLEELQLRELMGINIAFIKRGEITINMPNRNEKIFPGDEVCVIGTDEQIELFQNYLKQNEIETAEDIVETEIVLRQFELINEDLIGKTIRQSHLREKTNGLVVGLERNGRRILNPDSHTVLEKNDILWIVGDKNLMSKLFNI